MTLAALNDIAEGFSQKMDLEGISPLDSTPSLELPEQPFELNTTLVVTPDFTRYFESVIELCPPIEPTLQALNTTLTGLDREYWELLPLPAKKGLEMLGYRRAHNEFFSSLRTVYQTSSEFGVDIDVPNPREPLGRLEQIRYNSWRENNGPEPPSATLFERASNQHVSRISDKDNFAKSLLVSPIYLKGGDRPTLETIDREGGRYYKSSQEEHIRAIKNVLDLDGVELHGW
jgi:hypothetical protein